MTKFEINCTFIQLVDDEDTEVIDTYRLVAAVDQSAKEINKFFMQNDVDNCIRSLERRLGSLDYGGDEDGAEFALSEAEDRLGENPEGEDVKKYLKQVWPSFAKIFTSHGISIGKPEFICEHEELSDDDEEDED